MFYKKIKSINTQVEKNINTIRTKIPQNNGDINDRYGVSIEKVISEYLMSNNKYVEELLKNFKINKNDILNVIYGDNLKLYTSNSKIDILIITKNKNIGISCKSSMSNVVGVLESNAYTFVENLDTYAKNKNIIIPSCIFNFFIKFQECGCVLAELRKKDSKLCDLFKKEIDKYWKIILEYCIVGKSTENNQVNYIMFYDKNSQYLGVYTIKEYLYLIEIKGKKCTLGSRMSLTYTSGRRKILKFKMQNPNLLINK